MSKFFFYLDFVYSTKIKNSSSVYFQRKDLFIIKDSFETEFKTIDIDHFCFVLENIYTIFFKHLEKSQNVILYENIFNYIRKNFEFISDNITEELDLQNNYVFVMD